MSTFWSRGLKAAPKGDVLRYQVELDDPYGHYLKVSLWLGDVAAGQQFALPVWIPGSYMVRDFSKHIVMAVAESQGQSAPLNMVDKSTWEVAAAYSQLCITLKVYAQEDSVRAAWFDENRAFLNGTSVFLRVVGRESWPCELTVVAPKHPALQSWKLATGLSVVDAPEWGFGKFVAEDYHALVDHPLEMGNFSVLTFEACNTPHAMVFSGSYDAVALNRQRLIQDLVPICEKQIQRFEPDTARPPFNRYLFLTHVTAAGYGGLEHRNSTALVCAQKDLPCGNNDEAADEHYQQFLGLCSHEYFHSWNVKRITPEAFVSPDYQAENYSVQLWAFEGITSYFDDLGVYQAAVIPVDAWLTQLGKTITRVHRGKGRLLQSVTESSFTAWTRFYQQDANAPNAIVSYYAKGCLVALCLDLNLRLWSEGEVCLDDVLRALWQRHGVTGLGVPENGIETLAMSMLPTHQQELAAFFELALHSTEDLPLGDVLSEFAVSLNWRAAGSLSDAGGKEVPEWRQWFGASWRLVAGELEITRVDIDSPAHRAGLSVKDRVVAINGYRADLDWAQQQLLQADAGDKWQMALFRGHRFMQKTVELEPAPKTTAWLGLNNEATPAQLRRRQEWLQC